jgi:antitoxin component YwqK of YwqJK toxin-antitoxin module
MLRVHFDDLDVVHGRTGATYFYDDKPFEGMAYETYQDGQLLSEVEFKKGIKVGWSRQWYKSGQLEYESFYPLHDVAHYREWFENGQQKVEVFSQYGIRIKEKRWNEDGQLVLEQELDEESPEFLRLQRYRLLVKSTE